MIKYVQIYQCMVQETQVGYVMVNHEDWGRLLALHYPRHRFHIKKQFYENLQNAPCISSVRKFDEQSNSVVFNFGFYTLKELNDEYVSRK